MIRTCCGVAWIARTNTSRKASGTKWSPPTSPAAVRD